MPHELVLQTSAILREKQKDTLQFVIYFIFPYQLVTSKTAYSFTEYSNVTSLTTMT